MTKKESKQVIKLLKTLNYFLSQYTENHIEYEEKEIMKGKFEIEVECMFQNRAALLHLIFNDLSIIGTVIDGSKLTIM